ncbi:MAG TPA: hypothetical protein VJ728_03725, partial [Candidatus Binataceae bacterium]|nr:hypothetical protein [Candidatus Binataceae bacterium]
AYLIRLWAMAIAASAAAIMLKFALPTGTRISALSVIPLYGVVYIGLAYYWRIPELNRLMRHTFGRLDTTGQNPD